MNAKQALKKAREHIEQLEYANKLYAADVRAYNAVIEGTVNGESICGWCEDQGECDNPDKNKQGCVDWMLRFERGENEDEKDGGNVDGAAAGADGDPGDGGGNGNGVGGLPAGLRGEHQITGIIPE